MEFNTLFTGKNFIELKRVDSTNNFAANLVNETNVPDGTVILAHFQENGRGQMGNTWHSMADQNLMTSIIYHLGRIDPANSFLISKAVSLGVYETIKEITCQTPRIKWPNDIYLGGQKIAGMLIENKWQGNHCTCIVGIGLNVNQMNFENLSATSLSICTSTKFEIKQVLALLLSKIEKHIIAYKKHLYERISTSYLNHLMGFGEILSFKTKDGDMLVGKIIDVKNSGHLILEDENKERRAFIFKEISFCGQND